MTDQQLYDLLCRLIGQFHYAAPWATLLMLAVNAYSRRQIRALEKDRDEWVELTRRGTETVRGWKENARKNYDAALSWKTAFETQVTGRRAATQPPGKPFVPVPELGHCHDTRCEARHLKVHACHDLTCKLHIHENRAR